MTKPSIILLIEKLINSEYLEPQIKEEKVKKLLSKIEIKEGLNKAIIEKNFKQPTECKECSSNNIDVLEQNDKYHIKCKDCRSIYLIRRNNRIFYKTFYQNMAKIILNYLVIKNIQLNDEGFYISGTFEWMEGQFSFLFFPKKVILDEVLSTFYEISQNREPILCILRNNDLDKILKLYSFVTFGKSIKVVPISILNKKEISEWLENSLKVKNLEDKIIKEMKEELRDIVISVNTNPKYALTLLHHLKTLKQINKSKFNWELLENIVSTVIQLLYSSDITIGGGRSRGRALPDNFFIVNDREGKTKIFGLIDCKSSEKADLSKEPTEKYLNYIEKVERVAPIPNLKKALIFVVFEIKRSRFLKFYERIKDSLKDDSYIIILPVDTLIIILEIYFNIIIKGEMKKKDFYNSFEEMLIKLFDNDFLCIMKDKYPEQNKDLLGKHKLFRLNHNDFLEEIKKIIRTSGTQQDNESLSLQEFLLKRYGKSLFND